MASERQPTRRNPYWKYSSAGSFVTLLRSSVQLENSVEFDSISVQLLNVFDMLQPVLYFKHTHTHTQKKREREKEREISQHPNQSFTQSKTITIIIIRNAAEFLESTVAPHIGSISEILGQNSWCDVVTKKKIEIYIYAISCAHFQCSIRYHRSSTGGPTSETPTNSAMTTPPPCCNKCR